MKTKVLIIYGPISPQALPDEEENLHTSKDIFNILGSQNIELSLMEFNPNINDFISIVKDLKPDLVINMVESVYNDPKLMILATLYLEHLGIPFTGGSSESLLISSNKVLSKEIMRQNKINTPDWVLLNKTPALLTENKRRWIIKPLYEDASIDIDDNSVTDHISSHDVLVILKDKNNSNYFAEEFIEGREFNVSIFKENNELVILPIAEIRFENYSDDKPKILNYKSKWHLDSFEYKNTCRTFDTKLDIKSVNMLKSICAKIWDIFNLKGYARIDFRMDSNGTFFVLEINANPCVAKDSGFAAAALESGMEYDEFIKRIML